jgi:hypothetical protein
VPMWARRLTRKGRPCAFPGDRDEPTLGRVASQRCAEPSNGSPGPCRRRPRRGGKTVVASHALPPLDRRATKCSLRSRFLAGDRPANGLPPHPARHHPHSPGLATCLFGRRRPRCRPPAGTSPWAPDDREQPPVVFDDGVCARPYHVALAFDTVHQTRGGWNRQPHRDALGTRRKRPRFAVMTPLGHFDVAGADAGGGRQGREMPPISKSWHSFTATTSFSTAPRTRG